jgi:hypothetical protein
MAREEPDDMSDVRLQLGIAPDVAIESMPKASLARWLPPGLGAARTAFLPSSPSPE